MKPITLGSHLESGGSFTIDIERLIETRMVIQANSGGGKSHLIRKLAEALHGKVQLIILDMEDEFASLRTKFDFVITGKDGDIPAHPGSAGLLARKALEINTDLICGLYELKKPDRIRFIKNFLDSMVNAPKDLWHPVVVILDEGHIAAPEKSKSEALNSVIDLASLGRKREFCLVIATQRPAKLDKDVVSECQNKLIGLGNTDADRERGARELGFTDKKTILSMRDLEPGQFWAVGPAFNHRGANLVQIDAVVTPHGKTSKKLKHRVPVATSQIKKMLAKLSDLPKEAEEELRTVKELQAQVRELKTALKKQPQPKIIPLGRDQLKTAYRSGFETGGKFLSARLAESLAQALSKAVDETLKKNVAKSKEEKLSPEAITHLRLNSDYGKPGGEKYYPSSPTLLPTVRVPVPDIETLGQCERKILGFLALKPGHQFTLTQISAMTGYRQSGGFHNALSKLKTQGLINRGSGSAALAYGVNPLEYAESVPHKLTDWISKLGQCEKKIYETCLNEPEKVFALPELGDITGYKLSGGFHNSISRLSTLGLIKRVGKGQVQMNPEVMEIQ